MLRNAQFLTISWGDHPPIPLTSAQQLVRSN